MPGSKTIEKMFNVVLDPEHKQALRELAQSLDLSLSETLRLGLKELYESRMKVPLPQGTTKVPKPYSGRFRPFLRTTHEVKTQWVGGKPPYPADQSNQIR